MLIMMITAATPMMIPSIERNERILLLATARRLTLNKFNIFIISHLVESAVRQEPQPPT